MPLVRNTTGKDVSVSAYCLGSTSRVETVIVPPGETIECEQRFMETAGAVEILKGGSLEVVASDSKAAAKKTKGGAE